MVFALKGRKLTERKLISEFLNQQWGLQDSTEVECTLTTIFQD
jgi:hypothetical protein